MSRRNQMYENKPSPLALEVEQELLENQNSEVFQAMMQKAAGNCFLACVNATSGKLLSGSEKNCLTKCVKSYIEAQGLVGDTYYKNIQEKTNKTLSSLDKYTDEVFSK